MRFQLEWVICLAVKSSSIQLDAVWFVCQLVTIVTSRLDILSLPAYHFWCSEGLFLVLMSTQFESVYSVEPELFDFCYSKGGHFPVFGSAASLHPSAVRWSYSAFASSSPTPLSPPIHF